MKKYLYLLIALLVVFLMTMTIGYFEGVEKKRIDGVALIKPFESLKTDIKSSEVYFCCKMTEKDLNNGNLASEIIKAMENEVTKIFISKTENTIEYKKCELKGSLIDNSEIRIDFRINNNKENPEEKYVSLNIVNKGSYSAVEKIIDKINMVFENRKIQPDVNVCLTGVQSGKKSKTAMNDLCQKALKEVKAAKIEGMDDGRTISISAYSPIIEDWINVNGNKINLNIAARYNNNENKTYFWLATPIITTEY